MGHLTYMWEAESQNQRDGIMRKTWLAIDGFKDERGTMGQEMWTASRRGKVGNTYSRIIPEKSAALLASCFEPSGTHF